MCMEQIVKCFDTVSLRVKEKVGYQTDCYKAPKICKYVTFVKDDQTECSISFQSVEQPTLYADPLSYLPFSKGIRSIFETVAAAPSYLYSDIFKSSGGERGCDSQCQGICSFFK